MTLHCIENEFLLQRRRSCKQGDIRNNFKVVCKGKEVRQTSTESDDVDDLEGVVTKHSYIFISIVCYTCWLILNKANKCILDFCKPLTYL